MADEPSGTPFADALQNIVPDGKHVAVEGGATEQGGTVVVGVRAGEHFDLALGVGVEKGKKPTLGVKGKFVW